MEFPEFTTSINKVEKEIDKVVTMIEEIEDEIKEKKYNPATTSSGRYGSYTIDELKEEKKSLEKKSTKA
jgi:hypothetical protein